jgi:hypothetical protein
VWVSFQGAVGGPRAARAQQYRADGPQANAVADKGRFESMGLGLTTGNLFQLFKKLFGLAEKGLGFTVFVVAQLITYKSVLRQNEVVK